MPQIRVDRLAKKTHIIFPLFLLPASDDDKKPISPRGRHRGENVPLLSPADKGPSTDQATDDNISRTWGGSQSAHVLQLKYRRGD